MVFGSNDYRDRAYWILFNKACLAHNKKNNKKKGRFLKRIIREIECN